MKRVFSYFKPLLLKVILCLLIKISGVIIELFIPILLSHILDVVVKEGTMLDIVLYGLLMIICSLGGFFGNCKANQIAARIARNVSINLRKDLFEKIMTLSASTVDEVTIPSLVARMSSDTYNIHQMCGMILRLGVRAPMLLIGGTVATLFLDPMLTLVILATFPFVIGILYLISKTSIPLFTKLQQAIDQMVQTIRETMTGIRVIKALSKEDYENGRFNRINQNVINYELKSSNVMANLNPSINLILNFGLTAVLVVGAIRVNGGAILPGKVLAFTTFFQMILNAVIALNRMLTVISKAYASEQRISYIMNLGRDLKKEEDITKSKAFIEFRNVNFSYLGRKNNLTNINFKLEKGETLGIIGSTGSGKSTIINLLLRLYDVNSGMVFVNHKNIKNYSERNLKSYFGTALQYDTLFADTIYNNIDFFRNVSKKNLDLAIKTSASNFIDDLEQGLNTKLSQKGTNLSGGQRQRIILARAIAAKPKILILDDSTSALDYKTESIVRENLKKYYQDTTLIIVSSRISSIKNADQILVLENGMIDSLGTHDELMKTSKIYQEICYSQLGGDADE